MLQKFNEKNRDLLVNINGRLIHREKRYGDLRRSEIRRLSVIEALSMLLELAA